MNRRGVLTQGGSFEDPRYIRDGDPRSQAIASGRTDDQHFLRAIIYRAIGFHHGDLFRHIHRTTGRVGGGADEAARFRGNDHAECFL